MSTIIMSACPVCGDDSSRALESMRDYSSLVDGSAVCGGCAERIANAYAMKHGGRWLSWANEPMPKPRKAVISLALRTQVFERDRYRCLRCGTHLALRADHVIPESEGGVTSLENLQTLCAPCNSWKGVKTIDFRVAGGQA
ncbi:HNH endonuclease [Pseudomonas sp. JH-2]|uniref:HNH endonuclease n=1 Tax=Pseudomonas sp. JH-2 TaxID=3114998 RepID=UPI002E2690BC|nr:HNH endonuclease [Pseudomonas sp. JH-2]